MEEVRAVTEGLVRERDVRDPAPPAGVGQVWKEGHWV